MIKSDSRCTACERPHTPRSNWCLPCRESLRKWLRMTQAERAASFGRAAQRWGRVNRFRGITGKIHPRPRRVA